MFNSSHRHPRRHRPKPQRPQRAKFLRCESLESRDLLSGVVTITIAAGALSLTGDNSNNSVLLQADAAIPTNFIITGQNGTALQLGATPQISPFTAVGITGGIAISLLNGNDSVDFEGPVGGGSSTVSGPLGFSNGNGADTTTINNVNVLGAAGIFISSAGQSTTTLTNVNAAAGDLDILNGAGSGTINLNKVNVTGNLSIGDLGGFLGDRTQTITNSTIAGSTTIVNSGGDSITTISNSQFESSFGGVALSVTTHGGALNQATLSVVDSSGPATTFQAGSYSPPAPFGPPPPALPNAIIIGNGDVGLKGVTTQFIGQSTASPVVVYGGVFIANPSTSSSVNLEITSFANAQVLGATTISNGATASTQTFVTNSKLGTQLNQGGPLDVTNGVGADLFSMSGASSIPFGALINNAIGGGAVASTFGSTTTIGAGSLIGTRPTGPLVPGQPGIAFALSGDSGVDTVNMNGATFGAGVNLGMTLGQIGLWNGNNVVNITGTTINGSGLDMTLGAGVTGNNTITLTNDVLAALNAVFGSGSDHFKIAGGSIAAGLNINLGLGTDLMELRDGTTAPSPPDPVLFANIIDGAGGIDTLEKDADVDPSLWGDIHFELFV